MTADLPRTPYDETAGLVYFPRMLDKVRLHAAGKLSEAYHPMLGDGFDGRCVRFLGADYASLVKRVLSGGTDDEVLEWCFEQGRKPSEEEIEVWSGFMRKRGWRDETYERVEFRMKEAGLEARMAEAKTMFDFIDLDEGRTPPDFSKWESPTQ